MSYTDIDNPELFFQAKTFSGNAGTNAITLDGSEDMQPDWVWLKKRNGTANHHLVDSVRGAGRYLYGNLTNAEGGDGTGLLTSFNSNGFTLDAGADSNGSGATGVSWNWKANGGTTSSNSDGSITSTVQANTTAGFSIVSYTGSSANSNVGTVGHGLGTAPKLLIIKDRDATSDWIVFHGDVGTNKQLDLNNTGAEVTNTNTWNNTAPSSSVFTIGNNSYVNNDGNDFIAYCFAEKKGYSKFSSYQGNGNADGTFIYTGFKPAMVIIKRTDTAGYEWRIVDNKRLGYNGASYSLNPNDNTSEGTSDRLDFVCNGIKLTSSATSFNASGGTYIFIAFAKSPFVNSSGVPTNAR
jgi:hypothetical protein